MSSGNGLYVDVTDHQGGKLKIGELGKYINEQQKKGFLSAGWHQLSGGGNQKALRKKRPHIDADNDHGGVTMVSFLIL